MQLSVRDYNGVQFKRIASYYSKGKKNKHILCESIWYNLHILGWMSVNHQSTQLLDERVHFRGTFTDVPSRALEENKWYILCAIVVDNETGLVPFYSHILGRNNCSMKGSKEK